MKAMKATLLLAPIILTTLSTSSCGFGARTPSGRSEIRPSFRGEDGLWNRPVVLSQKINAVQSIIPAISPDGKYIFFHREGDIWWVSSKVIDRPV